MPDLPGSTPELDNSMFNEVLENEFLQADQWKIYPCETIPFTTIERWHQMGKYEHYSEEELIEVIIQVKSNIHPWIRLNRVIRDIPTSYHIAGVSKPNMRQIIQHKMGKRGLKCKCIRCREVKKSQDAIDTLHLAEIVVREYKASEGIEYFISMENTERSVIYGFCRLRLSENTGKCRDIEYKKFGTKNVHMEHTIKVFPELINSALVRELHVYGTMNPVDKGTGIETQHRGIGKKLLAYAEKISIENGYKKIAVISGVGVREYYRKRGYSLISGYMIKSLDTIGDTSGDNKESQNTSVGWLDWVKSFW
jgi:ELP3 family radical SAM enzyme/protein acetyltransferase